MLWVVANVEAVDAKVAQDSSTAPTEVWNVRVKVRQRCGREPAAGGYDAILFNSEGLNNARGNS